jgi:hypothetical protein
MGTQSPCDPPHPDNCWGTANTLSHTGGAGVGGSTPVTLNYTVDLTFLGAYGVATVLEARSTYVVDAGGSATITDNGGSAAVGSAPVTIEWDPWKIDLWLNSATGKNAPIQAVGTFPFGGGHFHVVEFWIMYKVCPDPRRSP